MSQVKSTEFISKEGEPSPGDATPAQAAESMREHAHTLARNLPWMPSVRSSKVFPDRSRQLAAELRAALQVDRRGAATSPVSNALRQNTTLLESCFTDVYESLYRLRKIPHVRRSDGIIVPRILAIAEDSLRTLRYRCSKRTLVFYLRAFQEITVLDLAELWTLSAAFKLVLLERLVEHARIPAVAADDGEEATRALESLRKINRIPWRQVVEPLIAFDSILQKDPTGVYCQMEPMSRDLYRNEVANIARSSDLSEQEVAAAALDLAEGAHRSPASDPRIAERLAHIGYYLVARGSAQLKKRAGFRPPFTQAVQSFLKTHPDDFYLPAIAILTAITAATLINLSGFDYWSFATYVFMLLVLMLPCSEAAVRIVNYLLVSLLTPEPIPKLDSSKGIPDTCATLVTVPMLLLSEEQVSKAVDDLEVRFLGNRDPNLHFALLTDLPDSPTAPEQIDLLALMCADLIRNLNQKYAGSGAGSFFLLHRERRYNPRERRWMGWERKRGKLLELNRFLRGEAVDYAKTEGNLAILSGIRFVISLDADTLLPRDTARRMIGSLAHPLNRVIVDPKTNVAVAGYGILQPRVGVSVRSAASSRLAKIWSGQTGMDIYTRATSDVYQDLYGEGTYVGKGIYEVAALHRMLDGRFPSNLLLSHDLIEGAYTRSGLVNDIEIVEDYPSVYSAFNRRKHRWVRGDWQVAEWLFPTVPGPRGTRVANPISLVSKWKIFDNLRRSLVEPATLLLFVLGWLVLPGSALYWTLAVLCLLFLPTFLRMLVEVVRHALPRSQKAVSTLPDSLFSQNLGAVLTLVFLADQMLLSLDAMVRALIRRLLTGERLLEWVTAAQEEQDLRRRTPLDVYLDWTPALAVGIGLLVWFQRRQAFFVALPILAIWASSKLISLWLNRSPHSRYEKSPADGIFLRRIGLRTWRFFAEFGSSENDWLIPDNVHETPLTVDRRLSPTNLGFLLNSRQVACELGYLTLPEFLEATQRTLQTAAMLPRYRGHLFNWYDIATHGPLPPLNVSSVDNGNLVASLWTLEQGCLQQLQKPMADPHLADGIADYLRELVHVGALDRPALRSFLRDSKVNWLAAVQELPAAGGSRGPKEAKQAADGEWLTKQLALRVENIRRMIPSYTPWLLVEFRPLRSVLDGLGFGAAQDISLARMPEFIEALQLYLAGSSAGSTTEVDQLRRKLHAMLPAASQNVTQVIRDLKNAALDAGRLAQELDFTVFLNSSQKQLAVVFDSSTQTLSAAAYDLLASEARMAVFVAIAKNEIPQESWFFLSRRHKVSGGCIVLLSWGGTMFEYLMPALWMNTYPDTLLDRAGIEAVRAQRWYGKRKGVPWGISECASFEQLDDGSYAYFAFGVPELALRESHPEATVVSPYSTLLAQHVSPREALRNLRKMERSGWLGPYGLYEAADFTNNGSRGRTRPNIVPIWMAHHQGMILLAIANSLRDGIVRRWFHGKPAVKATELLLQERPVATVTRQSIRPPSAA